MRHTMLITAAFLLLTAPSAFAVIACGDGITPAMIQYGRDVLAQLAQASDDDSIFAAAVISELFSSPPAPIPHDVLLRRAQIAAPSDPHIWWASALVRADTSPSADSAIAHLLDIAAQNGSIALLDLDRAPKAGDMSRHADSAIAHLLDIAPQNGAVWLLELDRAQKTGDTIAEQIAVNRLAHAKYFDDYTAAIKSRILRAVEHTQVSAAVPEEFYVSGISAYQKFLRRFVSSFSESADLTYPALQFACAPERAPPGTQQRSDCVAIGGLLVEHSTSWRAMDEGLRLQQNLAEGPLDIAEVERRRRNFEWLQSGSSQRSYDADREYQSVLEGQTEQESARIMLTEAGLPLEPPAEWKSRQAAQPSEAIAQ